MSDTHLPGLIRLGDGVAPLSFAQERLWFIDAVMPGSPTYNVPLLVTWRESVDVKALSTALDAVVARHEVLRTTYRLQDGAPVQVVGATATVPLEVVTASTVDGARADAAIRARQGFDLAAAPPIRCVLWKGLPDGDLLLLNVHHIAVDGWSLAALFDDLATAYTAALAATDPALPELPVQYADFAVWDRATFDTPAMGKVVADRVEELRKVPGNLVLGGARPATADGERSGDQHVFPIPDELWDRVAELAKSARATPFVVLFAAYQAVLQRWSGRDEFLLGTVTANRQHADVEDMIGFFVNTVPLRCKIGPEWTFERLCKEVRVEAFKSLGYQRIPFDQLTARGPRGMVDIGFALQNMPAPSSDAPWGTPEQLPTGTAKFDLILIVEDDAEGRRGRIEFATDQYTADVARRLGENYLALLTAAVADPGALVTRLPISERPTGVLVGESHDLGDATSVLDLVGRRSAPDSPAVSAAGHAVSWRELDSWSWAVARRLRERGIGPGDFVPVIAARGGALVAGWLGALRTGAAYAPLSLDTPADRLDHVLAELGAGTVLVDAAGAELIAPHGPELDLVLVDDLRAVPGEPLPAPVLTGREPAVVIYTSGTTGRPKGVLVPHGGMLNTCEWWGRDNGLGPSDRMLCTWSTSFDGATHDVFRALIAGAELVFADDVERRDPPALARLVRETTVTSMTPSLLRAVLDADQDGPTTLRTLYVGGEGLPPALAEECTARWNVPLRNVYGPTEASCVSTYAPVDLSDGQAPAIGVPLPNTRAYVLGRYQEELPEGIAGELYVAGAGVALGYLDRPELTEKAFLPDPHGGPGSLMYRTGDRVLLRADGLIECFGRVDDQVKVLGNRIELGEVAKLLEERPGVRAAAVRAEGDPLHLVAWVELSDADVVPDRDDVLRPLLRWLPAAVLPAQVYVVDALPMTGNDKTDFTALDGMRSARLPHAVRGEVELTPDQRRAAGLFASALDREVAEFGSDGNFFTLGGHSLLAVRMLATTSVALRDFLADPTIAGLGRLLDAPVEQHTTAVAADDRFPATSVQQRFWFVDRLASLRTAYLAPVVTEFTGQVDVEALRAATESVLGRHPSLRSRFTLDVKRRKVFYRTDGSPPPVVVTDAGGWSAGELEDHLAAACWTPFDLAVDAPARAEIVTAGERAVLVLTAHHIAADGWSHALLAEQIAQVYRGAAGGLAEPVHPASLPTAEVAAERIAEVVAGLEGAPIDVELPHDRERPAMQTTDGAVRTAVLAPEVTATLRALGAELGSTTFMTAAALLAVALARRGGQRDFLFAFPWAGRDVAEAATAVGMFVNTLVLRVDLRGEPTWREVLVRVRDHGTSCYRNADVPFDAVAAALQPERDLGRPPVTPVYLTALPEAATPPDLGPGTRSAHLPLAPLHVKYELELTATDLPEELELSASYATGLFDEATVDGLLTSLVAAATDLAIDPDAPALKEI
ncbi:MAG: amino acid adenylation domain-containing protein [Umezawaea sp.]